MESNPSEEINANNFQSLCCVAYIWGQILAISPKQSFNDAFTHTLFYESELNIHFYLYGWMERLRMNSSPYFLLHFATTTNRKRINSVIDFLWMNKEREKLWALKNTTFFSKEWRTAAAAKNGSSSQNHIRVIYHPAPIHSRFGWEMGTIEA